MSDEPILFTVIKKTNYTAKDLAGIKHLPVLHELVEAVMLSDGSDAAKKEAFVKMIYARIEVIKKGRRKDPISDRPTTPAAPGK